MIKNNKRSMVAVAGLICMAFISGCGGSGGSDSSTSASVTGKVADGYLKNALVFLDKNLNYQLDDGEPSTRTDESGAYTLDVAAEDIGKFPIVAVAIANETIDMDAPDQKLTQSYVLCTPAAGVSGTISNFISPMSTLLREKLESGMTLTEAMVQLRNQMDLPVGMNLMGDYVQGSTGGQYQSQYRAMHQTAQQMAGIMADQAGLVMSGTGANEPRFRATMGEINQAMPQITATEGSADIEALRTVMRSRMQTRLNGIGTTSGFGNYSSLFRNMTGHSSFWSYSGETRQPRGGMM